MSTKYNFGCDPDKDRLPAGMGGGHTHLGYVPSWFSRIVSSISSKIMMIIILIYLFFKTLVNPVFNHTDRYLADGFPYYWTLDWLKIIANAGLFWTDVVYLPEARADLLFQLGLYFPEEK
jgi:hypothetical protein